MTPWKQCAGSTINYKWIFHKVTLFNEFQTGFLEVFFFIFWKFDVTGLSEADYQLTKGLTKCSRDNLYLNLIEKNRTHYSPYVSNTFYSALVIQLTL